MYIYIYILVNKIDSISNIKKYINLLININNNNNNIIFIPNIPA